MPESLLFEDYSELDICNGKVGIVSQEESKLWISAFKDDDWRFEEGKIYQFPRDDEGKKCNIEGVSWITDKKIVVVSDSKKKKQSGQCKDKEEAIHIFNIPG